MVESTITTHPHRDFADHYNFGMGATNVEGHVSPVRPMRRKLDFSRRILKLVGARSHERAPSLPFRRPAERRTDRAADSTTACVSRCSLFRLRCAQVISDNSIDKFCDRRSESRYTPGLFSGSSRRAAWAVLLQRISFRNLQDFGVQRRQM